MNPKIGQQEMVHPKDHINIVEHYNEGSNFSKSAQSGTATISLQQLKMHADQKNRYSHRDNVSSETPLLSNEREMVTNITSGYFGNDNNPS